MMEFIVRLEPETLKVSLWWTFCVGSRWCFYDSLRPSSTVCFFFRLRNYKESTTENWDKILDFLPENCLYCLNCRHHLTMFPAIISSLSLSPSHSLVLTNFSRKVSSIFPLSLQPRHVRKQHTFYYTPWFLLFSFFLFFLFYLHRSD